jgi:hypothetical protein
VTAGETVAKGTAANPGAADTAATAALTMARAAEKTRLQAIVNPFALNDAAAITAAYAALPS